MNCNKIHTDLISGSSTRELEQHLADCDSCRELYQKVNDTMALLDEAVPAPANLAASILERREEQDFPKVRRLNITSIVQVAAAVFFGVFIGYQFGKITNTQSPKITKSPINQYFEAHHFNLNSADTQAPTLYIKN